MKAVRIEPTGKDALFRQHCRDLQLVSSFPILMVESRLEIGYRLYQSVRLVQKAAQVIKTDRGLACGNAIFGFDQISQNTVAETVVGDRGDLLLDVFDQVGCAFFTVVTPSDRDTVASWCAALRFPPAAWGGREPRRTGPLRSSPTTTACRRRRLFLLSRLRSAHRTGLPTHPSGGVRFLRPARNDRPDPRPAGPGRHSPEGRTAPATRRTNATARVGIEVMTLAVHSL